MDRREAAAGSGNQPSRASSQPEMSGPDRPREWPRRRGREPWRCEWSTNIWPACEHPGYFEVLANLPYFSGLPVDQIATLFQACEVIEVERGQVVIVEGSPPEGLLVVVEGVFEATREAGSEQIRLGDAGKGEVLGEMSILENQVASATVRALEKGTLIKVPVEVFRQVLSDPGLLGAMVEHRDQTAPGTRGGAVPERETGLAGRSFGGTSA